MKTSDDMTALATKIVNASEVKRLYKAYETSDPYTKPIPEHIRRAYVKETKTPSNTTTNRN